MKFLLDNILLIATALLSGALLLWPIVRRSGGAASVGALEATRLINHRNAIVVDVRDEKDYLLGSLAGARNLPFAALAERATELVRFKSRPVVLICNAGQQSARAIATFTAQGFGEAYSLAGGIAAWKQAGLPLVQPGRESAKAPAREAGRKSRDDQRPGERTRGGKAPRNRASSGNGGGAPSAVVAVPAASVDPLDASPGVVADTAPAPPAPSIKELP